MLNVKFLFTYIYIYSLFCKLRKIVFDTWLIKFWSLKATVNSTSKFVPSRVKTCVDVINKLFVNAVFSFCLSCFRKLNETWQPKIILLHEWRKEWKTCSNGRELVTQPLIFTWFHWLFYVAWCKNCRTGVCVDICWFRKNNFYLCPRSFAFRPNIHVWTISQPRTLTADTPAAWSGLFTKYRLNWNHALQPCQK